MTPQTATLRCHAATSCTALTRVDVEVQRSAQHLSLRYRLLGQIEALRLPQGRNGQRRDELWRHTCAELFVALPQQRGYFEFNFSPAGEWAAYQFDDYRQGMRAAVMPTPAIACESNANTLAITVDVTLPAALPPTAQLQAGVTMVIEQLTGECSYWALLHGAEHADFHRRDSFSLNI